MEFQWYPGHMTKAKRQMQEDIKLIDLIIEVIDARCPVSSTNPDINSLANGKLRLVLLNKSDLSDRAANQKWIEYYKSKGYYAVELDSRDRKNMKGVQATLDEVCAAKFEKDRKRGIKNRPVRAMVVGIPNVGKSTFINSFAGKSVAKTGNKPGVTKGKQWIKLNKSVELLDTPGILWPKFEDKIVGLHLAFIGSMNDENIDTDELACELIKILKQYYPNAISEKYNITDEQIDELMEDQYQTPASAVLSAIAINRKCFKQGATPDISRASALLLDDFRNGRLGRLSLERPD